MIWLCCYSIVFTVRLRCLLVFDSNKNAWASIEVFVQNDTEIDVEAKLHLSKNLLNYFDKSEIFRKDFE